MQQTLCFCQDHYNGWSSTGTAVRVPVIGQTFVKVPTVNQSIYCWIPILAASFTVPLD
jgi:hypothetical protein